MNSRTPIEQRFLDLVAEHQLRLRRICCGFTSRGEDREALYQEMLFGLWRALPQLKEAKAAATWAYRVVLNGACSFDRKREARKPALAQPATPGSGCGDSGARLIAAMGQLNPLERALAVLYLENLSLEEMAAVLGFSSSQVGEKLPRLQSQLFTWLQEPAPNEATLSQSWQQLPAQQAPKPLSEDQQLQAIKTRQRQFERTLRKRNRVEIVAALILMMCFGVYFFLFRAPLARLGCVVVILSAAAIGWKLLRAKQHPPEAATDAPLVESLRQELVRIEAQVRRLQSSLYLNIAPLMLGLNLFCFGLPRRGVYKIYFLVITLGLTLGVYWLNERALRRKLVPLKDELQRVTS